MSKAFKRMTGGIVIYLIISYTILLLIPNSFVLPTAVFSSFVGSLLITIAAILFYRKTSSPELKWILIAVSAYFIGDLGGVVSGYFSLTSVNLNVLLDFPYTIHLLTITIFLFRLLDIEHFRSQKLLILDSLTLFTVAMIAGYLTIFKYIPEYTRTFAEQLSWDIYSFLTIL
ncbi:MAG: hypothetical protein WBV68_08825, partial [Exiguobacterium oxidotolerans]